MSDRQITLGIPKGSLQQSTLGIFERVGLQFTGGSRTLWLSSNDPEIVPVLLKPQEIPMYVKSGRLDAGLSGRDWIVEQDVLQHIAVKAELPFSRQTSRPIRWVLAVPAASPIKTVEDLRAECDRRRLDGDPFVISTELTRISRMWLARQGVDAHVEFSWGATEAKAEYFADAIIEGVETGSSLRANHLREVAEVFSSTNQFFVSRKIYRDDEWKRAKLDAISHLIRGALRANDVVELRVVADKPLALAEILGPDARVVAASEAVDGQGFTATVTLPRASVPYAMPAVIAAGATDAWVSPMSIYYSHEADATSKAAAEARNASASLPLAPLAPATGMA
ncbi:ATP phosphoribosyltransferase [Kineosporia sp. J2-2]|uniref:ATP phosphoribosyltransferase n=1 Tax=Kineosporia corallincola TaxID=2835133 RepID=A0ABS5TAH4_9ACTN|nr:ATP phosphoribosyltransferase [Kineosporia corallincola]MBT0768062.1 ATP phosphoribosyltransferase [Kineosporia corallincola]